MNLIDAHAHIGDFPGFVSGGERRLTRWSRPGTPPGWIVD